MVVAVLGGFGAQLDRYSARGGRVLKAGSCLRPRLACEIDQACVQLDPDHAPILLMIDSGGEALGGLLEMRT